MGDVKAKHEHWNSKQSNARGRLLFEIASDRNVTIFGPLEPTSFPDNGNRPDVLDITLLHNIHNLNHIRTINDLFLDHDPVVLELFDDKLDEDNALTENVNWDKFTEFLSQNIIPIPLIKSVADLEDAVQTLTSKIQKAMSEASVFTKEINVSPCNFLRATKKNL